MTLRVSIWPEVRIGDLGTVITGRTPSSERPSYFGRDFPFITPGDMRQGKYVRATQRWLSHEGAALLARIQIPEDSVCVSCIGWQMGEVIMTAKPCFTNQQINTIVPNNKAHPSFLYYSLRPRKLELLGRGAATGVRTPIMNKSAFCDLRVTLPPLRLQRRIASILGNYDGLIEVNRRRIAILEEIAQRLFDEWFVHYRFPGHEVVGMIDDGSNRMPFGWQWLRLEDVLDTLEAGGRPKGGIKDGYGDISSIGAENVNGLGKYDYDKDKLIPRDFFAAMRRGVVRHGDVLLYKDGAHIGRLSLARDGFPHAECAINEHVFLLRPRAPVGHEYLYFWLTQTKVQKTIKGLNSNAAQPGLNQPAVFSLPILVPSIDLLSEFERCVSPHLSLLISLAKANRRLELSRDLLLPRLISGELSVAIAERELEAAD